jgi:hypothetical protein
MDGIIMIMRMMIFAMTYYRVHTHAAGLSDGPNLFALNNLA